MRVKFALLLLAVVLCIHSTDAEKVKNGCNRRQTAKIITEGITKLFCIRKRLSKSKRFSAIRFLMNYFRKNTNKKGYLRRRALKQDLRLSLKPYAKGIRRKIANKLGKKCVGQFVRWLGRRDRKVGRREFVFYFLPVVARRNVCKRFKENFYKKETPKQVIESSDKSKKATKKSENVATKNEKAAKENKKTAGKGKKAAEKGKKAATKGKKPIKKNKKGSKKTNNSSKAKKKSSNKNKNTKKASKSVKKQNKKPSKNHNKEPIPYCPPGYYKKLAARKKCFERTAKLIRRGFRRLYCNDKWKRKNLTANQFLGWYFKNNKTRNNYLPRAALRKTLRQKLPKFLKKLRKQLVSIKTSCLRRFKKSLNTNKDFKISKQEFVEYFTPYLNKSGLCERYWKRYSKYYS